MKTGMSEDRKQRLIRAAMKNFAKNGYKKTAMDEIVADAEISKGLIFHHYGSKKKLYLYLYEFAYGLVYEQVMKTFDLKEADLFKRIRESEQRKLAVMEEYPDVLDFLISVRREPEPLLRKELEAVKTSNFPAWEQSFADGIDTSRLRDDADLDQLMQIIHWCIRGLLADRREDFILRDIFREMDEYLDLLQRVFYKEEWL